MRTKGRNEVAKLPENKIVTESDTNAVEQGVAGNVDGEEAVEASESMEIVLHISEDDDDDKTDVEAEDEILLDGKKGCKMKRKFSFCRKCTE